MLDQSARYSGREVARFFLLWDYRITLLLHRDGLKGCAYKKILLRESCRLTIWDLISIDVSCLGSSLSSEVACTTDKVGDQDGHHRELQ